VKTKKVEGVVLDVLQEKANQTSRIPQTYIVTEYTFGVEGVTKVKKLHIPSVVSVDSMASEGITTRKSVTTATTEGNQQQTTIVTAAPNQG
jgi:hypothetical protein